MPDVHAYLQGGEGREDRFVLRPDGPLLVGRSKRCDVVIADPRVSKQHARLWFTDPGWHIDTEPTTTNPLLVNGVPVVAPTELTTGDVVGFGRRVSYTFIDESTEAGTGDGPTVADEVAHAPGTASDGPHQGKRAPDSRPARLRILDICEALVQATPPGWPDTPKAWVISTCDPSAVPPRDVHRLWDARNRAAHASHREIKHHRMVDAAAIAEKIVTHLAERGLDLDIYQTAAPADAQDEAPPR
jgi:predicted component of type VI protein secretion system